MENIIKMLNLIKQQKYNENKQSPYANRLLLVPIVPPCPPVIARLIDHLSDELFTLTLRQIQLKSVSEWFKYSVTSLEARKIKTRYHCHLYKWNNFLCMFTQCQESFDHQFLELLELLWVKSTHHINILLSQFECHCLEVHVSGWIWKHKSEVYMHNMAAAIQQNVAIVTIFNLHNETKEWITSHWLYECSACFLQSALSERSITYFVCV